MKQPTSACLDSWTSISQSQPQISAADTTPAPNTGPATSSITSITNNSRTPHQYQMAYPETLWNSHKICFELSKKVWLCTREECNMLLKRSYIPDHCRKIHCKGSGPVSVKDIKDEIARFDPRTDEEAQEQEDSAIPKTSALLDPIPMLQIRNGYRCLYHDCCTFSISKRVISRHVGKHPFSKKPLFEKAFVQVGFKTVAFGVHHTPTTVSLQDDAASELSQRAKSLVLGVSQRLEEGFQQFQSSSQVQRDAREITAYFQYRNWNDYVITDKIQ